MNVGRGQEAVTLREGRGRPCCPVSGWLFLSRVFFLGSPNLRTRPPPRRESSLVCVLYLFSLFCSFSGGCSVAAVSLQGLLVPLQLCGAEGREESLQIPTFWGRGPARQFIIENALYSKAK